MTTYRISEVARQTGFASSTLRYYEQIGLVRPERSESRYRAYSDEDVRLLEFIGRSKRLGLTLEQIGSLADAWRQDDCRSTQQQLVAFVEGHLADVRHLIAELVAFRDQLDEVYVGLTSHTAPARCGKGCGCEIEVARIDLDATRSLALVSVAR